MDEPNKSFFQVIKKTVPLRVLLAVLLFFVSWAFYIFYDAKPPKTQEELRQEALAQIESISKDAPLELIIMPDDGIEKIEDIIKSANESLDLVVYQLRDANIAKLLVDAHQRGVNVRVILEQLNFIGENLNQETYDFLQSSGVKVKWSAEHFALTHQKTIIVDGKLAVIMTFNLTDKYYVTSRDFGIINTDPEDVKIISDVFNTDWEYKEIVAESGKDLVWSPDSSEAIFTFIDSAKASLDVYCQEMADERITKALIGAVKRGVVVRVNMTYQTSWKPDLSKLVDAGAQVKTYSSSATIYIHAKVIIADSNKALVSSQNFSFQSLELNRELGIFIAREDIIKSLKDTFEKDWEGSRIFESANAKKDGPVKLSSSGICHTPESPFYSQTKNFTAFANVEDCIKAGGRLLEK